LPRALKKKSVYGFFLEKNELSKIVLLRRLWAAVNLQKKAYWGLADFESIPKFFDQKE
jgi:hypothetical protein